MASSSIKIPVSGLAHLVPLFTKDGETTVAEWYANWETGNQFTVPASADEETIRERYFEALAVDFK